MVAPESHEPFSLLGGPLHRIGRRLGLVRGTNTVGLGFALGVGSWLVVVALAVAAGVTDRLFPLSVVGGHARLLLAIPLFFMCECVEDIPVRGRQGGLAFVNGRFATPRTNKLSTDRRFIRV